MKIVSPFEPLSFWAQGPWVFLNLGLKFMQTWQEECFSRLRLTASVKPTVRADLKLNAAASEREVLGAIAARQGRETPLLGCLQNAKVVGGPESVTVSPKAIVVEPAAKPAPAPTVKAAPAPVAKAAPAKPQAAAAVAPVVTPTPTAPLFSEQEAPLATAAPVEGAAAAPSVTSMLAMQAKSLAKAVKTAPPPAQNGKANGKSAAKPTAKVAAQATAKAAVKAAPKAKPAAKAKPVASKKA